MTTFQEDLNALLAKRGQDYFAEYQTFNQRIVDEMGSHLTAALGVTASATPHSMTTGSKSFTMTDPQPYGVGARVVIARASAPATRMYADVTAVSGASLTVNVAAGSDIEGSGGPYSDWVIQVTGKTGATGPAAPDATTSTKGILRTTAQSDTDARTATDRAVTPDTLAHGVGLKGSDIASASTLTLPGIGDVFDVTGTTTITAISSRTAGRIVFLEFDGALTLTHNGTSLVLPGAANLTTAAGDTAVFQSEGSGNWRCISFQRAASLALQTGIREFYVAATSMMPATTNGAALGAHERTTNKNMVAYLAFDQTTQEHAWFNLTFPKDWDGGTVTFIPHWTAASGSGGVVWELAGVATSDDDALDAAVGTGQSCTDTLITAWDKHTGPASSAITIAGFPAYLDNIAFRITRVTANGSDTLNADALLLGLTVRFTVNKASDA